MEERERLREFRAEQSFLAIFRDGGFCTICWFLLGDKRPMDDVHHVYGRGRDVSSWRESYKNLLCVCREHHPPPIQIPGANSCLRWVEDVLEVANENPINPDFCIGEGKHV